MDKQNFFDMFQAMSIEMEQWKKHFVTFIQDTTIPLDDRWEVFVRAPDQLKETQSWGVDFPEFETKYGEIFWYDDFYIERYQTVYMTDLVGQVEEKVGDGKYDADAIRILKESILAENLESFIYDW